MIFTPDYVAKRFQEAAYTLRRMPAHRPKGYSVAWPTIVYTTIEAYGWEPATFKVSRPSGAAIDRLDETLDWLWIVDDDRKALIWHKAVAPKKGLAWISQKLGISRRTAYRWWRDGLVEIAGDLTGKKNI